MKAAHIGLGGKNIQEKERREICHGGTDSGNSRSIKLPALPFIELRGVGTTIAPSDKGVGNVTEAASRCDSWCALMPQR